MSGDAPVVIRASETSKVGISTDFASASASSSEDFAALVKERTRSRRERENAALSTLITQVSRLEAALQAETKRRSKAIRSIEERASKEIQLMEENIRKQIHEETGHVEQRLRAIEDRLSGLEDQLQSDLTALNTDLERNRREIDVQVKELFNSADKERQNRIVREKMLEKQLSTVALEYQERWTNERLDRMASVNSVNDELGDQRKGHEKMITGFEQKIRQELALVTQELEQEVIERQSNDDEIVAALNRYTSQLQQTLAYATDG